MFLCFFYILLELLKDHNILLIKISEIILHAFQNYNHAETITYIQCAIYNYFINQVAPSSLYNCYFNCFYQHLLFHQMNLLC